MVWKGSRVHSKEYIFKKMIKNKKASVTWLLKIVLELLIAGIVIFLLVYFLGRLLGFWGGSEAKDEALRELNNIVEYSRKVCNGEIPFGKLVIYAPEEWWYFAGFRSDSTHNRIISIDSSSERNSGECLCTYSRIPNYLDEEWCRCDLFDFTFYEGINPRSSLAFNIEQTPSMVKISCSDGKHVNIEPWGFVGRVGGETDSNKFAMTQLEAIIDSADKACEEKTTKNFYIPDIIDNSDHFWHFYLTSKTNTGELENIENMPNINKGDYFADYLCSYSRRLTVFETPRASCRFSGKEYRIAINNGNNYEFCVGDDGIDLEISCNPEASKSYIHIQINEESVDANC